jgi:hypothetical protein
MVVSQSSALQTSPKPHLHVSGECCPFCDQPIHGDRLEEIRGRIAAREQERLSEAMSRLREQHARESSQAETAMLARIARADEASAAARQAQAVLAKQLEQLRIESAAAIENAAKDAAAKEAAIRAEAATVAEGALRGKLAAAEEVKIAAEQAKAAAEAMLMIQLDEAAQQIHCLRESHANEINHQREVLEKGKIASVNAERAKNLETQMRLEEQLQDMQRRLQKKTPDEHGEGAERELFELVKAAFPDDRIRRVEKGAMGADIVHAVVENGKVCGKIVYDRKNRGNWKTEYATKLRADQIAEKADHAILSTNKFPDGEQQICMREHVILACPARVPVLAQLLREHIIQTHKLRVSNEASDEKTAELYAFVTSERCRQLLDSIETLVKKLEEIDVAEQKVHSGVWKKRGELLKSVLKANGVFCFEIDRIVGTAQAAE